MGARTNLWVLDKALLWAVRHTRGEEMAYTAFSALRFLVCADFIQIPNYRSHPPPYYREDFS